MLLVDKMPKNLRELDKRPFKFLFLILKLKCQKKLWLITNCYLINVSTVYHRIIVILAEPLNFVCIISRR